VKNLLSFKNYKPEKEYKSKTRREIDLDSVRRSPDYRRIINLGFKEDTSHQQELNNTLKFVRTRKKQSEKGHDDVFYTIHPTGTVRRYNPVKGDETPEGSGNDIKKFDKPFKGAKDYIKALNYLWQYLLRKQERKDFR
jgi:hypothetical protein